MILLLLSSLSDMVYKTYKVDPNLLADTIVADTLPSMSSYMNPFNMYDWKSVNEYHRCYQIE